MSTVATVTAAEELSKVLRDLREMTGMNLRQFGKKLGYSHTSISNVENRNDGFSEAMADKIWKVFPRELVQLGYSIERLHDLIYEARTGRKRYTSHSPQGTLVVTTPADYKPQRKAGWLPVVGRVGCSNWAEAVENDRTPTGELRMEYVGTRVASKKNAFLVEAEGDSMTGPTPSGAVIREGDLLLVEPDVEKRAGDVVLAIYRGDATVKIYQPNKDGSVRLVPTNTLKYDPLHLSPAQAEDLFAYPITGIQQMIDLRRPK